MEQTKLITTLANDHSTDTENQIPSSNVANEIRTLGELELMITGGGDHVTAW